MTRLILPLLLCAGLVSGLTSGLSAGKACAQAAGAIGATDAPAQPARTLPGDSELAQAWQRVQRALSPSQQAFEVRAFVNLTGPGVPLDLRHRSSGRAAGLDDPSVWQRPQDYEATVTVNGRFYSFRPLSRSSLDPFRPAG